MVLLAQLVQLVALARLVRLVQRAALVPAAQQVRLVTRVVAVSRVILAPLVLLVLRLRLAQPDAQARPAQLVFLELLRQPARLVQPVMLQL